MLRNGHELASRTDYGAVNAFFLVVIQFGGSLADFLAPIGSVLTITTIHNTNYF